MRFHPKWGSILFVREQTTSSPGLLLIGHDTEDYEVGCESVHRICARGEDGLSRCGPPRNVISLHPGNVGREVPVGENPAIVPISLNQFMKAGGNYLAVDFLDTRMGKCLQIAMVEQSHYVCVGCN